MINVFAAAAGAVAAVQPFEPAKIYVSTGENATLPSGKVEPGFAEADVSVQVQAASSSDLQAVENITQQADYRVVFLRGAVKGVERDHHFGGDYLRFHGAAWKVVQPLENWGTAWSKLLVARQSPSTLPKTI